MARTFAVLPSTPLTSQSTFDHSETLRHAETLHRKSSAHISGATSNWQPLQLPKHLQALTHEIKQKEKEVEALRAADRIAYKSYKRTRAKLASRKYRSLQDKGAKEWYTLWIKCADELKALSVSVYLVRAVRQSLTTRRHGLSGKKSSW